MKKKKEKIKINMTELIINSKNKPNRVIDKSISSGCGFHVEKKHKKKEQNKWKKEIREYI